MAFVGLEWVSFFNLKTRVIEVYHPEDIVGSEPVVVEHRHDLELRDYEAKVNMNRNNQNVIAQQLEC
jgi:hypothetical protein